MKKNSSVARDFLKVNVEQMKVFEGIEDDIYGIKKDYDYKDRIEVSQLEDGTRIRVRLYGKCSSAIIKALDSYFGFNCVIVPNEICVLLEYGLDG